MIIINDKDKNENIKFRPMFDYYFLSTCRPTVAYFWFYLHHIFIFLPVTFTFLIRKGGLLFFYVDFAFVIVVNIISQLINQLI